MKLKNLFIVATVLLFAVTGCEKENSVTGIALSPESATLTEAGATTTLTATLAPSGTKADITWTSSNPEVATVVGDGLTATVTAVGNGTATITAAADIFTAEATITVNINSTGEGTKDNPYSVEDVISKSSGDKEKIDVSGIWAKGYIVGHYNSDTKAVETTDADGYNLVIASSASETDQSKMVCVQLPAGDVRTGLALKDNPTLLGKEVKVHGDITTYNTMPGIKNTDGYWLTESNTGINPPEAGGFNLPEIKISDLQAMYQGSDVTLDGTKKIVGVITSDLVGGNSTSLKNVIITALDNQSGIMLRLSSNNTTFDLGDKVEIKLEGTLTQYSGQYQVEVANANVSEVGTATITPRTATVSQIAANIASYNYCVVTTEGTISGANGATVYGSSSAHTTNTLTDGADHLDLFVSKYATFITSTLPTNRVTVTGIAQSYGTATETTSVTNQIIIRNLNDVK